MDFNAQLELLKAAQGDPAKLALATVDLLLGARPEEERAKVRGALEAAAVPHWFDEKILAALLKIPEADAVARMVRLRELNVVEPFPARGPGAMNVHEAVRAALRSRLATDAPEHLRTLSARAHAHFAADKTAPMVVEALYHRFTAEPEEAAAECGTLMYGWFHSGDFEAQLALGAVLEELLGSDQRALPPGLVRGSALYNLGSIRLWHPRLEDRLEMTAALARAALEEFQSAAVDWCIALAHELIGDVFAAKNRLAAALSEYRTALEFGKAAAVTHSKVGAVLVKQSDMSGALAAFRDALAITERIAKAAPDDGRRQRDLHVSHLNIGDILRNQSNSSGALESFHVGLAIAERLVAKEPGNALWQRDLSLSHERIAEILLYQGDLPGALASFRASLGIIETLSNRYPTNAELQTDLAISLRQVADVLLRTASGDQAEAQRLIARGQRIMDALARAHPLTLHEQEVRDNLERLAAKVDAGPENR